MSLGMPYMGSKRKLSKRIVDYILEQNPNCKYFYDLFGGGGAISFEALQRSQIHKVVYNELNTGIVAVLRDIQANGIGEKYYQWIDRETFKSHVADEDWFGGFLKTCWSFGGDQKSYLFSKENERIKKSLHLAIVENREPHIQVCEQTLGLSIPRDLFALDTINERRLAVMDYVKKANGRTELQRLEQLERLQQLEQLERLQRLEILNESFENVLITTPIEETVIYLDPPYEYTKKYEKGLDHHALTAYMKASKYRIYMSGYMSAFESVQEFSFRSTFSASNNSKKIIEKLFTNKPQEVVAKKSDSRSFFDMF